MKYSFEKKIVSKSTNTMYVYQVIEKTRKNKSEAFSFGTSVAAPMVYQYVEWVLESATKNGIDLLLFVMRDGYILKAVADVIIRHRGLNIQTKYIFGSRVAWRYPELTLDKLRRLNIWDQSNWIFRDPAYAYVPLNRLGFSKSEISRMFGNEFCSMELKTFEEFKRMIGICLKSEEFCHLFENKVQEAGELLIQYLVQELPVDQKVALVDTNSTGKTQADLEAFLKKHDIRNLSLRFFYHTYLATSADPQKQFVFNNSIDTSTRLPEALLRAPYNQCYGYRRNEDGVIVPVFCDGEMNSWSNQFDYDAYLQGIVSFTENIEKECKNLPVSITEYADILFEVVNLKRMSKDVIKIMGTMPFNPDMDGHETNDFYPKLRFSALLHPFRELIYYPKASFYLAGMMGRVLYRVLYGMVELKRAIRNRK